MVKWKRPYRYLTVEFAEIITWSPLPAGQMHSRQALLKSINSLILIIKEY